MAPVRLALVLTDSPSCVTVNVVVEVADQLPATSRARTPTVDVPTCKLAPKTAETESL